jgi:glycosyltransferase involved in cell wall biosynthesis
VSLVIPAYRESARLPAFGAALVARLAEFEGAAELRVVDDGSGEEDARALGEMVAKWGAVHPWVKPVIFRAENGGKGAAVYEGWAVAASEKPAPEWLGFCDADGSVNADEAARLIQKLDTLPSSVVALIASRRATGARCGKRSVVRAWLGRVFAAWVRIWLGLTAKDTQCGCKFVRTSCYLEAAAGLTLKRYAFDAELLAALERRGGRIAEEGVLWHHAPGGVLRVWWDGPVMLGAVVAAAMRRRLGGAKKR